MSKYPNTGSLGKNRKMREEKKEPSHTGQCEVDGVSYWISAWVKEGEAGKFFSLSFKPKEEAETKAAPEPKPYDDDEIPF